MKDYFKTMFKVYYLVNYNGKTLIGGNLCNEAHPRPLFYFPAIMDWDYIDAKNIVAKIKKATRKSGQGFYPPFQNKNNNTI